MNIKKISKTILYDNIISSKLKLYKENWNNSTSTEKIPLYSIYIDFFNKANDLYHVYLGINEEQNHVFSNIDLASKVELPATYHTECKFIKSNLLAVNFGNSCMLFKAVNKPTKELQNKIYEIIKAQYTEVISTGNNVGYVNINNSSSSWTQGVATFAYTDVASDFVKKDDFNNLENRVTELEKQIKDLLLTK